MRKIAIVGMLLAAAVLMGQTCTPTPTATPTPTGGHMSFQLVGKGVTNLDAGSVGTTGFVIPDGEIWELRSAQFRIITTAVAGARAFALDVRLDSTSGHTIRFAWVPVTTPENTTIRVETNDAVASVQTYTTIGGELAQYVLPWSPIPVPSGGRILLNDLNLIDILFDQATLIVTYDVYRFVADAAPLTVVAPTSAPVSSPFQ